MRWRKRNPNEEDETGNVWTQEEREQIGTKRKHQKLASVNQSGVMNEKPHTYGRKNEHN